MRRSGSSRISQDHPGSSRIVQDLPRCCPSSSLLPFSTLPGGQLAFPTAANFAVVVLSCLDSPAQGHATREPGLSLARYQPWDKRTREAWKRQEGEGKRGAFPLEMFTCKWKSTVPTILVHVLASNRTCTSTSPLRRCRVDRVLVEIHLAIPEQRQRQRFSKCHPRRSVGQEDEGRSEKTAA